MIELGVFWWLAAALALTVNNSDVSLGEAYQGVCKVSRGQWENPVPAELQAQYGRANAGCYFLD